MSTFQSLMGFAGHLANGSTSCDCEGHKFQSLMGFAGHLAGIWVSILIMILTLFQSLMGFAGHLACHPPSIAREAVSDNGFREALFWSLFLRVNRRAF
jgi:hypothetical protein